MIACKISRQSAEEQFPEVRKSIISGKGKQSFIIDYKLTRYACCLIVMNGDPRKEVVARGRHDARRTPHAGEEHQTAWIRTT